MKQNDTTTILVKLWKWLEVRFREIDLKIDHILFRMRYEDLRVNTNNNGKYSQNGVSDDLEVEEEFRDI